MAGQQVSLGRRMNRWMNIADRLIGDNCRAQQVRVQKEEGKIYITIRHKFQSRQNLWSCGTNMVNRPQRSFDYVGICPPEN